MLPWTRLSDESFMNWAITARHQIARVASRVATRRVRVASTGSRPKSSTKASCELLLATGYPKSRIHFVTRPVEQTLPSQAPDPVGPASPRHRLVRVHAARTGAPLPERRDQLLAFERDGTRRDFRLLLEAAGYEVAKSERVIDDPRSGSFCD
jgi:hypothetical protein